MRKHRNENTVAQDALQQMTPAVQSIIPLDRDLKNSDHECMFEAIDPDEETRLVRKIDLVILSIMAFVYLFQCIYRTFKRYCVPCTTG